MANKAYQFRLYPTKEQEGLLCKTFGCVRFCWLTEATISREAPTSNRPKDR